MMNRWGWDQEIKLHMLHPDNVAVTLSTERHLASTCDAACLSYIKVHLAGNCSLNTTCNEGIYSYLSHHNLRHYYSHLCYFYSVLLEVDYTNINILKSDCDRASWGIIVVFKEERRDRFGGSHDKLQQRRTLQPCLPWQRDPGNW